MAKDTTGGPTTESLREALRSISDPASGKDIVAAGLVEGVELRGGLVQVSLLEAEVSVVAYWKAWNSVAEVPAAGGVSAIS